MVPGAAMCASQLSALGTDCVSLLLVCFHPLSFIRGFLFLFCFHRSNVRLSLDAALYSQQQILTHFEDEQLYIMYIIYYTVMIYDKLSDQ